MMVITGCAFISGFILSSRYGSPAGYAVKSMVRYSRASIHKALEQFADYRTHMPNQSNKERLSPDRTLLPDAVKDV